MTARLCIMAKTPHAGEVKTRLQPPLNRRQAADVAGALLSESVRRFSNSWSGPVELWIWPDRKHPLVDDLVQRHGVALFDQARGNLGAKMQAALDRGLRNGCPSAVIGADIPHVDPEVVTAAERLLNTGRAVYGPSSDGGFWLLGLTRPVADVFAGVSWSSDNTGSQTLSRARSLGIDFEMVGEAVRDIDTIDDLDRALRQDPALEQAILRKAPDIAPILDDWRQATGLTHSVI